MRAAVGEVGSHRADVLAVDEDVGAPYAIGRDNGAAVEEKTVAAALRA